MQAEALPDLQNEHGTELPRIEASRNERRTRVVVVLTIVVMIAELIAGFATGSMALLADGYHMGTHAAALGFSAFAYWFARSRASHRSYTFGTGKVHALAGYTSSLLLGAAALYLAFESFVRLLEPRLVRFEEALVVAAVGLVANLVSALLLTGGAEVDHDRDAPGRHGHGGHGHAHGHGGHGHGGDAHGGPRQGSADPNHRAAYLHVVADALTSLLAIVALLAGRFFDAAWLDPAMGILGSIVIGKWAFGLFADTARQLLDTCPSARDEDRLRETLEGVDDVRVLDLHVWEIAPGRRGCILSLVSREPREVGYYRALVREVTPLAHLTVEVHRLES